MLRLIDDWISSRKVLNRFLSLRMEFLVCYAIILSNYLRNAEYWLVELRNLPLLQGWAQVLLLWVVSSGWSWLGSSLGSSDTPHFNILLLSCLVMLQNDLIHSTMYLYMRLSAVVWPSSCKKATLSTSCCFNPCTLDRWRFLIEIATIVIMVILHDWGWLVAALEVFNL